MSSLRKFLFSSTALYLSNLNFFENSCSFVSAYDDNEDDDEEDDDAIGSAGADDDVDRPSHWIDSVLTTMLWKEVSQENPGVNTEESLESFLRENPSVAKARSRDGRGGIWWAWEYKNFHALAVLKAYGAEIIAESGEDMKDLAGKYPYQMCDPEANRKSPPGIKAMTSACYALISGIEDKVKVVLENKKKADENDEKDMDALDDKEDDSGEVGEVDNDDDDEEDL